MKEQQAKLDQIGGVEAGRLPSAARFAATCCTPTSSSRITAPRSRSATSTGCSTATSTFHQVVSDEEFERHARPSRRPTRTLTDPIDGPRADPAPSRVGRSAFSLSRIAGLVRQRVFAHYFGLGIEAADALTAAFRIPNVLQNLFGDSALSASFIPVYASLLARGERRRGRPRRRRRRSRCSPRSSRSSCSWACSRRRAHRVIAPGFHGSEARADDRARAGPLSGRRSAGAVRVVPRRPELPSTISAVVHGARRCGTPP